MCGTADVSTIVVLASSYEIWIDPLPFCQHIVVAFDFLVIATLFQAQAARQEKLLSVVGSRSLPSAYKLNDANVAGTARAAQMTRRCNHDLFLGAAMKSHGWAIICFLVLTKRCSYSIGDVNCCRNENIAGTDTRRSIAQVPYDEGGELPVNEASDAVLQLTTEEQ